MTVEKPQTQEQPKVVGVIFPQDPVEYLSQSFKEIPNFVYTALEIPDERERAQAQSEIQPHRERLEKAVPSLPEIGKRYAALTRTFCERLHLNPGKMRVYLVGGRVRGKPFTETTDFDLVITVEHVGQGLQVHESDSFAQAEAKRKLYPEWKEKTFEIDGDYGLVDSDDHGKASFIECKSFGRDADNYFVEKDFPAVLIYSE